MSSASTKTKFIEWVLSLPSAADLSADLAEEERRVKQLPVPENKLRAFIEQLKRDAAKNDSRIKLPPSPANR